MSKHKTKIKTHLEAVIPDGNSNWSPETSRPSEEELRSGQMKRKSPGYEKGARLRLPPPTLPEGEFTDRSTPVPMASLIKSDCKISEGKNCVFYLYIFSDQIYHHTVHITKVQKQLD